MAGCSRPNRPELLAQGDFVDPTGKVLGTHEGHQHFTIGQRKGIGLAFGHPVYVTAIDPHNNRVTLGERESLLRRRLIAREVNWIVGDPSGPREAIRCRAKVRYNSDPAPATAMITGRDELTVHFDEPVLAITPGQAVVCCGVDSDEVIGGGWTRVLASA